MQGLIDVRDRAAIARYAHPLIVHDLIYCISFRMHAVSSLSSIERLARSPRHVLRRARSHGNKEQEMQPLRARRRFPGACMRNRWRAVLFSPVRGSAPISYKVIYSTRRLSQHRYGEANRISSVTKTLEDSSRIYSKSWIKVKSEGDKNVFHDVDQYKPQKSGEK